MNKQQTGVHSILLAPITAATTARTANLDISNADYVTIVIDVSAEVNTNSTNVAIQLLESDDTTVTNFATFNSAYNVTIDNTAAAKKVLHVEPRGRKKYLRLALTPDTTTNGAVISCAGAILTKDIVGAAESNAIVG